MKKLFSVITFSIMLIGCSKSFLDRQPEDTLSPGIFYTTPQEIKTGVVGIYAGLPDIFAYYNLPHILAQLSDDGTMAYNQIVWHTFYKDNTNSAPGLWNGFYKMIVNANNIIDIIDKFVPKNDVDKASINVYRGEASFLRAFAYFYLVRLYGDVPMIVKHFDDPSTAFGVGRAPVNDIYTKVIIPDLEFAFANCYKKDDPGLAGEGARATKGAALTMLAKVYLTMKDYTNAASTLKRLIVDKEAGDYSLLTDYSKIWLPTNKFNSESIFEINYNVQAGSPSFYFRNMTIETSYRYGLMSGAGSGLFVAEKNLMDEYVAYQELTRYRISVDSSYSPNNFLIQPTPLKLMPPLTEVSKYGLVGTDYNFMVTRYADALLMYAEALMQLGQKDLAVPYVNQVRARVNMPDITAAELDIDRILHERRMELAFEGHRYFDLVRTGKAIEYISRDLMSNNDYESRVFRSEPIPAYQLILPIPVTEIEKDQTLTQNVGY